MYHHINDTHSEKRINSTKTVLFRIYLILRVVGAPFSSRRRFPFIGTQSRRTLPSGSSVYVISFESKSGSSCYLAYLIALHLTRN